MICLLCKMNNESWPILCFGLSGGLRRSGRLSSGYSARGTTKGVPPAAPASSRARGRIGSLEPVKTAVSSLSSKRVRFTSKQSPGRGARSRSQSLEPASEFSVLPRDSASQISDRGDVHLQAWPWPQFPLSRSHAHACHRFLASGRRAPQVRLVQRVTAERRSCGSAGRGTRRRDVVLERVSVASSLGQVPASRLQGYLNNLLDYSSPGI